MSAFVSGLYNIVEINLFGGISGKMWHSNFAGLNN